MPMLGHVVELASDRGAEKDRPRVRRDGRQNTIAARRHAEDSNASKVSARITSTGLVQLIDVAAI